MSSAFEHVKSHLVAYLLPIIAMALWGSVVAFMDSRHEPAGAGAVIKTEISQDLMKTELRQLKREQRKLLNYQRLSPNSEYSASRQAEIDALEDEIESLEMDLK